MNKRENHANKHSGVLFSDVEGRKTDEHLHEKMLDSVASVADEAGIRILMESGLSRELACKLVRPSKSED